MNYHTVELRPQVILVTWYYVVLSNDKIITTMLYIQHLLVTQGTVVTISNFDVFWDELSYSRVMASDNSGNLVLCVIIE